MATSSPSIPPTATGATAGSLTIALSAAGSLTSGATLALFVTASSGIVHWKNYSISVSGGISYTKTLSVGNDLNIVLGKKTATRSATIYITKVKFTTYSAEGSISVSPTLTDVTFSPSSASDGTVQAAPSGPSTPPTTTTAAPAPASSGTGLVLKADTPEVTVVQDAYDAPISPVHVVESSSVHVPVGYVCLTVSDAEFDATAAAVTVAAGNGIASTPVTYQDETGTAAPTAEFQVTRASTTAGEYTVSGLAVNADTRTGPVTVIATFGTNSSCAEDMESIGSVTAVMVTGTPVTRIYGATPDATAAAELEHQFDANDTDCPGRTGARPVVLATDAHYPDALTSAYLASSLGTGELLTPTKSLSAATANAIRLEGITEVYIVGGSLAVSTAVSQELESTLAYNCGGTTPLTSDGPVHIEVIRISGATEYETALWVAEYPAASDVGSLDVTGAYAGTNGTGGTGKYNDTAGKSSAIPGTSSTLPTAIVTTGRTFQDAEAASVLSYADRLPILLTTSTRLSPQVSSVVSTLDIKQVIVMGGPLAVSNAVVSKLESLGVTALRIAGHDASDTAVQLADFEMGSKSGQLGAGWSGTGGVTVARGDSFTDGLAGAIVAVGAGRTHTHGPEPLLLSVDPSTVGPYLSAFLTEAGHTGIDGNTADQVTSLTILGGPQAVSSSAVTTMTDDL